MKQLLVLSGKGGTGKTTVASAFIRLAQVKAYADCDVDAPNLHLVMGQTSEPQRDHFMGMPKARIDRIACTACGRCIQACRFRAIQEGYRIDPYACEGCGLCEAVCPSGAVCFAPDIAGELVLYAGGHVFSTATLRMGSGTSGKLVSEVKKRMKCAAPEDAELAIVDGSPGIGCPVIASLSGADLVLLVCEPSVSGISDMERIVKTARTFRMALAVCVNKFDVNPANTGRIEAFCAEHGIPFVGKIPFDPEAVRAVNSGVTIADVDCPAGRAAREVYRNTIPLLYKESDGAFS